jgi:hypothetical protein
MRKKMDIENRIKDQRTAIAASKDYIGPQGVFCFIAKNLGDQIIQDSLGDVYQNYLPEFNEPPPFDDDFRFQEMDENATSFVIGYAYNKSGLEIVYKEHDASIKVYYQGYLMYHEISEDLQLYKPNKLWEDVVEIINQQARIKYAKKIEEAQHKKMKESKEYKQAFLQELKDRWGDDLF